jgi:catechol 2,3-dioxygenase-like lactoylglutathione lyase family enzyme
MIKGVNHIGLSVVNLDRAIVFYRDIIGMELVVRTSFSGEKYETILALQQVRGEVALMQRGDLRIELFEFSNPQAKRGDRHRPVCDHGITHFCLQVTDLQQEYERMRAAGVAFHCPPQTFGRGARATYGRDMDGNVFELLETADAP